MARVSSGLLEPEPSCERYGLQGPARIRRIRIARPGGSFVRLQGAPGLAWRNRFAGKGMPLARVGRVRFRADFRQAGQMHVR